MPRQPSQKAEKRSEAIHKEEKRINNKHKVVVESDNDVAPENDSEVSSPVKKRQTKQVQKKQREPTTPVPRNNKRKQNNYIDINSDSDLVEDDISQITNNRSNIKLQNPPSRKQKKVNPKAQVEKMPFPKDQMMQKEMMIQLVLTKKKSATYENLTDHINDFTETQLLNLFVTMEQESDIQDSRGYYVLHQDILDDIKRKEEEERIEQERVLKERLQRELEQEMEIERLEKERLQKELKEQMEQERLEQEQKMEAEKGQIKLEKSQMEKEVISQPMDYPSSEKKSVVKNSVGKMSGLKSAKKSLQKDMEFTKNSMSKIQIQSTIVEEADKENTQQNLLVTDC